MAIVHFINYAGGQSPSGMKFVLEYIMQDSKTVADGRKFVTGVGCCPETAALEFQNTKKLFRSEGGRQFYHFVQSFRPEDGICPAQAHEIALELAEKWEMLHGFELVAATHCDRDHIHTHFVFNSVSAETGKKFHICQKDVEKLMALSDEIITAHGFSPLPPPEKQRQMPMTDREYRSAERGESWKIQLAAVITGAMEQAGSQREFRRLLSLEGYAMTWTPERKYITYTCPNGKKCRDSRLHEEKYRKENMEYEFRIRKEIYGGTGAAGPEGHAERRKDDDLHHRDRSKLECPPASAAAAGADAADGQRAVKYPDDPGAADRPAGTAAGNSLAGDPAECGGYRALSQGASSAGSGISQPDGTADADAFRTGWEHQRKIWQQSLRRGTENEKIYRKDILDFSDSLRRYDALGRGTLDLLSQLTDLTQAPEDPEQRKNRIRAEQNGSDLGTVLGAAIGVISALAQQDSEGENDSPFFPSL